MTLPGSRVPRIAATFAAAVAIACVSLAGWGAVSDSAGAGGVAVGNKVFVAFRDGVDFRVGLRRPAPVLGLFSVEALAAEETLFGPRGHAGHWLRLPEVEFSLWWPFWASVGVVGVWAIARRPRAGRGFPVTG
jgi:hypothetical protein